MLFCVQRACTLIQKQLWGTMMRACLPKLCVLHVLVHILPAQVFTDWDSQWGDSERPVQISTGVDALEGLTQLQVLVLDIATLVRCGLQQHLMQQQHT